MFDDVFPVQLMAEPTHRRQSLSQMISALFEPLHSIGGLARGAADALWQLQGEEWSHICTYIRMNIHTYTQPPPPPPPHPHPHFHFHLTPTPTPTSPPTHFTSLSAYITQHLTCVATRRLTDNPVTTMSVNGQCRTAQRSHHPASRGR